MSRFAKLQQEFASFAQTFVVFKRKYPDPQSISLPIARTEGEFDLSCRSINSSLVYLKYEANQLARQSPDDLPAKPDSVTDAFIWPLKAVCAEVDGQPLSLHDVLTVFSPYQTRQQLGEAYSEFCALESAVTPDLSFEVLRRAIGHLPQDKDQASLEQKCNPGREYILDCPEFGYTSEELTKEVHQRMSRAHITQAERQFCRLAEGNPLDAKKTFDKNLAGYVYWGRPTEPHAQEIQTAFNEQFPLACRRTARTEALALMETPAHLDGISGSSPLEFIAKLMNVAGIARLKDIFNTSEKIGDHVLTQEECGQRLLRVLQYHDAAKNHRYIPGYR